MKRLRIKEAALFVRLKLENHNNNNNNKLLNFNHHRCLSSIPDSAVSDHLDNHVLVEEKAWSRTAILNRPSVLNALNASMGARLQKLYTSWENKPDVGFVIMKERWKTVRIFRKLYGFIYILGTYLKPHVALLHSITMGGGAGVSIPGTFRLATEKTVFATPETLIGFHPDAGASFYLSHLPGHLGEYLALTGEKLNGEEMFACGLATHYSHSSRLELIEEQLVALVTDDPSEVEASLEKFSEPVNPEKGVMSRIETIDKCFGHDTVEEIIDAVESEAARANDAWCPTTAKRLKEVSPLSLKVSLRSIRESRFQNLDQCLVREYRMSLQGISKQVSGDFLEGVRARLVEKDSAPKWDPPTVEQVSQDMVDQYFSPLSEFEPDLELPTNLREAFTSL